VLSLKLFASMESAPTIQVIDSLVEMVSNLTKEVTHLKKDNSLLKQK
jgi:hypothetical protein